MISLLFVAVNSALLGRALFYSYKLFLDGLTVTGQKVQHSRRVLMYLIKRGELMGKKL